MAKVVVTSYVQPDLDGYACAVAYTEFLNKTGKPAALRIFGIPHIEARHLLEKFGFRFEEDSSTPLDKVILVDASELKNLDEFIKPEHVVEVIDHRKFNDADSFINAKIQIELVGSAATLIAEKFYKNKVEISIPAATMLYGAIVSNTLNFRAKVTTERDKKMAQWLNEKLGLGQDFIDDMFRAKSNVEGENLAAAIDADFAHFDFGAGGKIGIGQLEIMDAQSIAESRKEEVLEALRHENTLEKLDRSFMSFIDLGAYCNIFVTDDADLQKILIDIFGVEFKNDVAVRPGYIMRKEITPLLKKYFLK